MAPYKEINQTLDGKQITSGPSTLGKGRKGSMPYLPELTCILQSVSPACRAVASTTV